MTTQALSSPSTHFTAEEFAHRREAACAALAERGLDGMLISRIEDQYWLTGLDTDGFCLFHAVVLGADGTMTHISRSADLPNVRYSSIVSDVELWIDAEGNSKASSIKATLDRHGLKGKRVGVQTDTYGLLPGLYLELREALSGWCELVDASDLIRTLRLVKSPQELAYHRRAGEIVDNMQAVGRAETRIGVFEGEVMERSGTRRSPTTATRRRTARRSATVPPR